MKGIPPNAPNCLCPVVLDLIRAASTAPDCQLNLLIYYGWTSTPHKTKKLKLGPSPKISVCSLNNVPHLA